MPSTTQDVVLLYGPSQPTEELEIKDFPDMGGAPNQIDTSTLKGRAKTYIAGLPSAASLEFTLNYDEEVFEALDDSSFSPGYMYQLKLGPDEGFEWSGEHVVWVTGNGVDAPVEMRLMIANSTPITPIS
jgi:hypothetical protein